jgi:hypothetical protein
MTRVALPLSLAAAALLAACASPAPGPTASAERIVTQEMPYRPGTGVVTAATTAPTLASAGATTPSTTAPATSPMAPGASQRLAIRMEDGSIQYVDVTGSNVPPVGSRVQLTADHQIIKQ